MLIRSPAEGLAIMTDLLPDGVEIEVFSGGNRWLLSWHASATPPEGTPDGSAGICVVPSGEVVVVSHGEASWIIPGGRPEGNESWEATLRREVFEEACAVVTDARLLGYTRGRCVEGPAKGPARVRSMWLARVTLEDWLPECEIRHRKLVSFEQCVSVILPEYARLWRRVFHDARGALAAGGTAAG
jgi:ADP-ribose pyrophosphatase YjhB (NUDIX family)